MQKEDAGRRRMQKEGMQEERQQRRADYSSSRKSGELKQEQVEMDR